MTKPHKKLVPNILRVVAVLVALLVLVFVALITFWDTEWQNWQVHKQIRTNHTALFEYKTSHGTYPDTLAQASVADKHCIYFKCFEIKYQVSEDKQSYTSAAKVNYPFIAFISSKCEIKPELKEDRAGNCAQIGYQKATNAFGDLPVYLENPKWFPNPSEWPRL